MKKFGADNYEIRNCSSSDVYGLIINIQKCNYFKIAQRKIGFNSKFLVSSE